MGARTFTHCDYGPLHLRRRLRRVLAPGELVVAWAAVRREPDEARQTLSIALGLTPGVGLLLGELIAGRAWRLVVLTDSRALLLDAKGRREPHGPTLHAEIPLADLRVRKMVLLGTGYVVSGDALGPTADVRPWRLTIPDQQGAGAKRLKRALADLAKEPPGAAG